MSPVVPVDRAPAPQHLMAVASSAKLSDPRQARVRSYAGPLTPGRVKHAHVKTKTAVW